MQPIEPMQRMTVFPSLPLPLCYAGLQRCENLSFRSLLLKQGLHNNRQHAIYVKSRINKALHRTSKPRFAFMRSMTATN